MEQDRFLLLPAALALIAAVLFSRAAGEPPQRPSGTDPDGSPGVQEGLGPPAPEATSPVPALTYIVEPGDTLNEIAARFGVAAAAIVVVNGLPNPDVISEGQSLTIPIAGVPLASAIPANIEMLLEQVAAEEGVDASLVKAIAFRESSWDHGAVSPTGAVGVMQIQPETGYWLEEEVFGRDLNFERSTYNNIRAGVRYLRILLEATVDTDEAIAAYYQGYGSLRAGILYEETVQYVADVKALRARFSP